MKNTNSISHQKTKSKFSVVSSGLFISAIWLCGFVTTAEAKPNCNASDIQLFERESLNVKFRQKKFDAFNEEFKTVCQKYERIQDCKVTEVSKKEARAEVKKLRRQDECIDTWIVTKDGKTQLFSMRHGSLERHEK